MKQLLKAQVLPLSLCLSLTPSPPISPFPVAMSYHIQAQQLASYLQSEETTEVRGERTGGV